MGRGLSARRLSTSPRWTVSRATAPIGQPRTIAITVGAIAVEIEGVPTDMEAYFAVSTENPPPPNAAYLAHLRDGARHHGLPEAYRTFLESLEF